MTRFEEAAYDRGHRTVAGLDEAGRGPLAGPVVAAAVVLPRGCVLPGLRDSKKLTPSQRDRFLVKIKRSALAIGIGVIDHSVIDQINILEATRRAMQQAVDSLPFQPEFLLIDALHLKSCNVPQLPIIHGDDLSLSIAAASVVAKVTRDRIMLDFDRVYPQYNFKSHKGYGTKTHLEAIRKYGPCVIHRMSFRGVEGTPIGGA